MQTPGSISCYACLAHGMLHKCLNAADGTSDTIALIGLLSQHRHTRPHVDCGVHEAIVKCMSILQVVYEDEHMACVVKPPGMPTTQVNNVGSVKTWFAMCVNSIGSVNTWCAMCVRRKL